MEIMTLEEVSGLLKVNERTIVSWIEKGEFPGGKIGSSWRFRKRDVEGWLSRKLGNGTTGNMTKNTQNSLEEFIRPNHFFYTQAESKKEIIDFLTEQAAQVFDNLDVEFIRNAIWHRESLMSTGIGLNIGIPHIRVDIETQVEVFFAVNKHELHDYESLDLKPVKIVILIIAGMNDQPLYLKALSSITFIIKKKEIRDQLYACTNEAEIEAVLRGAQG